MGSTSRYTAMMAEGDFLILMLVYWVFMRVRLPGEIMIMMTI